MEYIELFLQMIIDIYAYIKYDILYYIFNTTENTNTQKLNKSFKCTSINDLINQSDLSVSLLINNDVGEKIFNIDYIFDDTLYVYPIQYNKLTKFPPYSRNDIYFSPDLDYEAYVTYDTNNTENKINIDDYIKYAGPKKNFYSDLNIKYIHIPEFSNKNAKLHIIDVYGHTTIMHII